MILYLKQILAFFTVTIFSFAPLNAEEVKEAFPFAPNFLRAFNKGDIFTIQQVRADRIKTLNLREAVNDSTAAKDGAAKEIYLGAVSDKVEKKNHDPKKGESAGRYFQGKLDLTEHEYPIMISILVDDNASLTVKGLTSQKTWTYSVKGGALWSLKSYKEFSSPNKLLPGGEEYEFTLVYENTANLSKHKEYKDKGFTDKDGVSVYLSYTPFDLDIIKPGTERRPEEIAEEIEDWNPEMKEGGWAATLNWDDDDKDGGEGGHKKITFVNDFDDNDGTENEDDLIQLKVHRTALDNVKGRLKFDSKFFRVWKKKNRKEEIMSGQTTFDIKKDRDLILYVEGKRITEAEAPKQIELQAKFGDSESFQTVEQVSLYVATPIIVLASVSGHGRDWRTDDLVGQLKSNEDTNIGKKKIDNRKNTFLVEGKNQKGKILYYSVDVFHVHARRTNSRYRRTNLDKEYKMALGVSGAHVISTGHANYGLGPNFNANGLDSIDGYTNLSSYNMAAPVFRSIKRNTPNVKIENIFLDLEHGGPNFKIRPKDIVQKDVKNKKVKEVNQKRWPTFPNLIKYKKLKGGYEFHHKSGKNYDNWYTIVTSKTVDAPALKYASYAMFHCSTGRHFGQVFGKHGVFIYTSDSCYSTLDSNLNIPGYKDLKRYARVYVSTHYVRMLVEGQSYAEITKFLTDSQYLHEDEDKKTNLYKYIKK